MPEFIGGLKENHPGHRPAFDPIKKKFGLTGPQLIILQTVVENEMMSVTQLSKNVSLSQATVTNITKRLENQGYLERNKNTTDKRRINLMVTEKGKSILEKVPPLLQKQFTSKFSELEDWEQLMIESAFNRVVLMMAAEDIDASPIMITGEVIQTKSV